MAKAEWGIKRTCPNCSTRYYDLNKEEIICPKCGTPYDPEALLKSRRARPAPVDDTKKSAAKIVRDDEEIEVDGELEVAVEIEDPDADLEVDDLEVVEGEDEAEDVLLEDAAELGGDEIEDVVEVEDGEEER